MPENQFDEQVLSIFRKDARYSPDAYHFVAQALHFTQEQFANPQPSGRELLEGIRLHALQLFGPATFRTFRSWGIQGCQHFADIVQNLVTEGCIEPLTGDAREDFHHGYDFAATFPRLSVPRDFLKDLCHLLLDPEEQFDLDGRFSVDGTIDQEWLAKARLDPHISNTQPTLIQVAAFHTMLERTAHHAAEARFGDALEALEEFIHRACQWVPKPDVMMRDLVVHLEPYCPEFARIVSQKFQIASDVTAEGAGNADSPATGAMLPAPEENFEKPERDFTGLHGFGQAPPVIRDVHVFVNAGLVDRFAIARSSTSGEMESTALNRPKVKFCVGNRKVERVTVVTKHFHTNVCVRLA